MLSSAEKRLGPSGWYDMNVRLPKSRHHELFTVSRGIEQSRVASERT
jgi:hypothetical protein